jgi:hypothetical protein
MNTKNEIPAQVKGEIFIFAATVGFVIYCVSTVYLML